MVPDGVHGPKRLAEVDLQQQLQNDICGVGGGTWGFVDGVGEVYDGFTYLQVHG